MMDLLEQYLLLGKRCFKHARIMRHVRVTEFYGSSHLVQSGGNLPQIRTVIVETYAGLQIPVP